MFSPTRCPACAADLTRSSRFFGLVRTYGPTCPSCGVALLFDTVGGVSVKQTAATEAAPEDGEPKRTK